MTTALTAPWQADLAMGERRSWAVDVWRGIIFCSLFSIVFAPEFAQEAGSQASSFIYSKAVGGFRFIDIAILAGVLCHVVCWGCLRRKYISFPRQLVAPAVSFCACIVVAIGYGKLHGGNNFFFDWRGLALGVAVYFIWSLWLQTKSDLSFAIRVFALYAAVRILAVYVQYLAGYRDILLGVSIPVFDGPVLSCIVFAGLLAFSSQQGAGKLAGRLLWSGLALAGRQLRARNLIVILLALVTAGVALRTSFSSRLQSLDVTQDDTNFSADNSDHVYDLVDAWEQVRQSPIMGIGLGTSYSTWHIRRWKPESVMVHNAPLHVWLKYGLAGLLCYLWFHLALLRWLYRRSRVQQLPHGGFLGAAFAYLAAQFFMTLGFAPWPYSELQLTTLISFIIAAAAVAGRPLPLRLNS